MTSSPLHHNVHTQSNMDVSDAVLRRRSADVGGLHLAMRYQSQGQGWLDSTSSDTVIETEYAELLTTMYRETLRLVENNVAQNDPPELSYEDRMRLLKNLDGWYFEPLRMPEHEVLACVLFLFQVLFRIKGMRDAIGVDMDVIPRFILHIRQLYRWQNHYHNFEHAVDVLQAIHYYLRAAGMVPAVSLLLVEADAPGGIGMWSSTRDPDSGPLVTCLTPHEIFALYLAAIGHDVAHPGFNNPFMKNAEAPLSQVYDNQSALEQLHSFLLLTTMRHHGLGVLLDDPQTGALFRKILKNSVLATDMGVHEAFMKDFAEILDGAQESSNGIARWQSTKCSRQTFICQLLLKNADISNPCRPILVSKQWASALQQEWACQYKFENFLQLRHSVNPSNEPLAEANSQVFFTRSIAKPLVDLTTVAIPELQHASYQCAENLREWERILEELKEQAAIVESLSSSSAFPPQASAPGSTYTSPNSSISSSVPLTRQNSAGTPLSNYVNTNTDKLASTLTSPLHSSYTSSPGTTPISATLSNGTTSISSSSSSASGPVSPRVLNPSENDYSTAFRLALPKATSARDSGLSPVGAPGSALSGPGKRQTSKAPSSNNGNAGSAPVGTGVLSPSLSRGGGIRVVCRSSNCNTDGPAPMLSRTQSSASAGSSSDAAASSSWSQETQRPLHQHSSHHVEEHTHIDGYRFPLSTSSTLATSPPPPPTAESVTTFHAAQARLLSQSQLQSHSNTPSISPSDSPSQQDSTGEIEYIAGEDAYELDAQAHHNDFLKVIERGLGVGSVKKKKSSNVLNSVSPSSVGASLGVAATPPVAVGLSQHANRASWCSGEPLPQDVDREVRTMEDAKGAIEKWRGRWGNMSMGGNGSIRDARTSSRTGSRAVAAEESEDEDNVPRPNGAGAHQYEGTNGASSESIPAGLVSAALDNMSPQTPPQQVGSLENENGGLNRSGSPTPKGKPRGITKMRETEEQRRKREKEELRKDEEARERIRKELIKQEERERLMLVAKEKNDGRKSTRSRSRSKLRKKGKGKK